MTNIKMVEPNLPPFVCKCYSKIEDTKERRRRNCHTIGFFIKNVGSSTFHKKTPSSRLSIFPSFGLSLREFKKILPNTFIYESIKIYVNANIMNT